MKKILLLIVLLCVGEFSYSMDMSKTPEVFTFYGKGNATQVLALKAAKQVPLLKDCISRKCYTLDLSNVSQKDLLCLTVYCLRRTEEHIFESKKGNVDPWIKCGTEQQMTIADVQQLIRHASILFPDDVAPVGLLESWYKKVKEKPSPDEKDFSFNFVSQENGIPLINGCWCKNFLLSGEHVIISSGDNVYESCWNNDEQRFDEPRIFANFNKKTILEVQEIQMDSPQKNHLLISTIQQEKDSFLFEIDQYIEIDQYSSKHIKSWHTETLGNSQTYDSMYKKGTFRINHKQKEAIRRYTINPEDFDKDSLIRDGQSEKQPVWFSRNIKIMIFSFIAIIAGVLVGKAYYNK